MAQANLLIKAEWFMPKSYFSQLYENTNKKSVKLR